MNWLAHLRLAHGGDEALVGAMLGDFVRGPDLSAYPPVMRREIRLHRRVDAFTDSHPRVVALRERFPDGRRRFAGIVLDIHFDHCLAAGWPRWSDEPLPVFTARVYAALDRHRAHLPSRLRELAMRLAANDGLAGYRERASVDRAVTRMATRLRRGGESLVACLADLRANEAAAMAAFEQVFADACAYVAIERARLDAPGGT